MKKPRVIFADTDEQYLVPLELKFLEELGDMIDLEIITDAAFFEGYFSKPRNADVLVISDGLYSRDLQKHNISNIFVLTEQSEDGEAGDPGITMIYKYTTVKEIYSQILAASSGTIRTETHKTKETTVVLVYSPSGGVGKTTLALGMCACYTQGYKKVLYINAEQINTFQHWMSNQAAIPSSMYAEFMTGGGDLYNRIKHVIRKEKFDYLPPFGAMLSSLSMNLSIYEEIVRAIRLTKEYDIIIIDTDSAFDSFKASFVAKADKVVMVLEQSKASVFAMNMLMKNMSCDDDDKYYFVCNKFDKNKSNALIVADIKQGFIVSEYVGHIDDVDSITLSGLAGNADIQKISFLII